MKDKLSIQCSIDSKEKEHILQSYKKHSISVASRVLNMIREDLKKLEGQK